MTPTGFEPVLSDRKSDVLGLTRRRGQSAEQFKNSVGRVKRRIDRVADLGVILVDPTRIAGWFVVLECDVQPSIARISDDSAKSRYLEIGLGRWHVRGVLFFNTLL